MTDFLKKHITKGLNTLLVIIFVACALYWWKSGHVDLDTARQTLSVLIQIEIAIFALTIAGLAFVSNVLTNQSARLDRLRKRWLGVLVQIDESALKEIDDVYQEGFVKYGKLPPTYKCARISHLSDRELIQYIPALIAYRKAAQTKNFTDLTGDVLDLDSDSMLLFRISCAVLFSDVIEARRSTDLIAQLTRRLKDIDHAEDIIKLVNNLYETRLATSRGVPVFVFFTLASVIVALTVLSVLSATNFSQFLYGLALMPIVVILVFSGYYISQILRRYF